jgi:hypothetical protein
LAFYGGAIVFVVILFDVVTAYGNANLKAPPNINGRYRINAQTFPGCLKSDALDLNIQQSGIYLSGSLLPADNGVEGATSAPGKPTLNGLFSNQQLSLQGKVPRLSGCNSPVKIEGKIDGKTLVGQISQVSTPGSAEFTAQQEAPAQQPKPH